MVGGLFGGWLFADGWAMAAISEPFAYTLANHRRQRPARSDRPLFFLPGREGELPPSPIPITRDSGTRGQRNGFGENVLGIHGGPYSTKRYPLVLGNACEASNYILMFPVVLIAWARNYILKIKNSRLISALLIYLLLSPPGCS